MAALCFSSAQAMLPTENSDADVPQLEKPLILKKKLSKTEQQRLELSGTRKWGYWWGTSCFGCCNYEATIAERLAQVLCAKAWQDLQPPIFSCEENFHLLELNWRKKNTWCKEQLALKDEVQTQLQKLFYNDLKDYGLGQLQTYAHRFWGNRNIELRRIESRISEILSRQRQRMLEEAEQKELKEELTGLRQELEQKKIEAVFYRAFYRPNFIVDWITCLDRGNICGKESLENLQDAVLFWQTAYGPHSVLQQLLEVMHQPHSRALLSHQENFEGLLPKLTVQSSQYRLSAFDEDGDLENRSKSAEVRMLDPENMPELRDKSTLLEESLKRHMFYSKI